ncbi:MAG: GNAT family N-acetyltransferase [Candidatus Vogelbacteria bacterium]|nr:GNAT family N-acetyltransferase [Candidatus Vogelbacteria bacterium]
MMTIQKPKPEDVKEIQDVFYQTWLVTYPNEKAGVTKEDIDERFKNRFSNEAIAKRTDEILDDSGQQLFLVAKDGNKIIGVCFLAKKEDRNQLQAIYVLPEYQSKGIGQMFWVKIKEFFSENKDIVVQVADYNDQAIAFYKKLGFVDTGKRFSEEKHKMPISGNCIPEMEMIIKAK